MVDHLRDIKGPTRRKNIQKAWIMMKSNISWSIGKGNINFWYDKWLSKGPIASYANLKVICPHPTVKVVLNIMNLLHVLSLPDVVLEDIIYGDFQLNQEEDQACWDKETSGLFTVKSA